MRHHTVKQGDCLESIAHHYGMDWNSLWNLSDNAKLKKLRKDPNLLYPGDIVYVPELTVRGESADTGARYRFVRKHTPSKLHVQLLENGEPLADKPYNLQVNAKAEDGQTDGYGEIAFEIHPEARQGLLTVTETGRKYILELGCLGPPEEVAGYQARLQNLGYYEGKIDGIAGEGTANAIASFQRDSGLRDTGSADGKTLSPSKLSVDSGRGRGQRPVNPTASR